MRLFDSRFKKNIGRYILQCSGATLVIIIILFTLDLTRYSAIIAALGASTFIVFTTPRAYLARPRALIGGYVIGIISGIAFDLVSNTSFFHEMFLYKPHTQIIFGGLAVGLAIFLMSIFNTEHAPAAGIALGLILNGWTFRSLLFVLAAITTLTIISKLLKPYLLDLREITPEIEENID
ncbi:MAG: HPP family protein [Candidatus Zixiibacteriota bacterium]